MEWLTNLISLDWASPEVVVSGCALFLTGYQAHLARKHNRLEVKPRLVTTTHTTPKETPLPACLTEYTATLINAGLGPAVITGFQVSVGGQFRCFRDWGDLDRALREEFGPRYLGGTIFVPRKGFVMRAGEERELACVVFADKLGDTENGIEEELKRIHLLVTYECAYGTSYKYDTRDHFA